MEQGVDADAESKPISILKVLSKSSEPIGSITIDRIGVIQIGGLDPVAATVETGIDIENIRREWPHRLQSTPEFFQALRIISIQIPFTS